MAVNLNAAAIRLLAEKGLSALDIAEIAEAMQPVRNANAERQARFRARQKAEKEAAADGVTVSNVTRNVTPPNEYISNPPELPPQSANADCAPPKRKRAAKVFPGATRLPDDWQPILTETAQALVSRWPPGRLEAEIAKFRDYAADKGRTSKDWQAAFRTWLQNSEKWNPANGTANRTNPASYPARDNRDGFAKALDEIIDAGGTRSSASHVDRSAMGNGGSYGDGTAARVITLRPADVRQIAADDASGAAHAIIG